MMKRWNQLVSLEKNRAFEMLLEPFLGKYCNWQKMHWYCALMKKEE
jgi:hypothetical protein